MAGKVLLCDDDVFIVRAAELRIRGAGFEVLTAHDGEEAWRLLHEHDVAALVTDRQMPRVDGVELIRRMRDSERLRDVPIVLLTSRVHDVPPLDVDLIIDKPFSPRQLAAAVVRLTEGAEVG